MEDTPTRPDGQRLDTWLWCARLMKQRGDCARLAESGGIRINRQPTDKAHAKVRVGDVLTVPLRGGVRVLEVRALAERRGAAAEARLLYHEHADQAVACATHADQGVACATGETSAYRRDQPPGSA